MGEKLYKRKEESLRELLKNSVDACRATQRD
jgi:HSP90 family molecular chaperone